MWKETRYCKLCEGEVELGTDGVWRHVHANPRHMVVLQDTTAEVAMKGKLEGIPANVALEDVPRLVDLAIEYLKVITDRVHGVNHTWIATTDEIDDLLTKYGDRSK